MKTLYAGLLGCALLLCCASCMQNEDTSRSSQADAISRKIASGNSGSKIKNCNIHTFNDHVGCEEGDLAVFLPARWSDEQLSLKFIAMACEKSDPIYMTKGGVICTYRPITPENEYEAALFATDKRREIKQRKYEALLSSIADPNSEFRDIGGNRWLKVITLGKGQPADFPIELKITYQSMNEDGKLIGKPSATKTSVVESVPDNVLVDYPEGSVIEYAKIDKEDLLASERGIYTIVSSKTYKPVPPPTPQTKIKTQKPASPKSKSKA